MKVFIATLICSLCTILPTQGKGWRGIVPLHSTRAEVEQILGPPNEQFSEYSVFYRTSTETVVVQYAQGLPCGIGEKYSRWNVPKNTVETILVTPLKGVPLSEFRLDEGKYEKRSGGHRPEDVYYISEEDGESIRVYMNEVQEISYFPSAFEKELLCPGLTTPDQANCKDLSPPRFDLYHQLSRKREQSILDNFSIALNEGENKTGFIISYAGKRARAGEALGRARRAVKYIVEKRRFDSNRLKAIDGGYREIPQVELYVVPDGFCPPAATPTIDPKDVTIVRP